ncbi:MAG: SH3 domain-containing protein [Pseudomonadota bacterium]
MMSVFVRTLLMMAVLSGLRFAVVEAREPAETIKISRFSGKPLPRFESLRYSAVHGRQGPNLDHPIVWRYERAGLPVLVVRETHGWRRIRDPDGDEVWMQARMLSESRTVMITRDSQLKRAPDAAARPKAHLKEGLVAELIACSDGWCEIEVDRRSGWLPKARLWGTEVDTAGL